jgi:hypothetical protein
MEYETLHGVVALARRGELKRRVREDGFKHLAIVATSSCVKPAGSRNAFN